ncbi:MAG: beta-N-acetylhexosaminidase, partial [Planctomycetes bacterium]|nr:beta-N-acetylhexosaminidase [Planctomycetota bacterium]
MHRFSIAIDQCPSELRPALAGITAERPDRFGPGGIAIRFIHEPAAARRLAVTIIPAAVEVRYATPTDAFRALGRLLGIDAAKKPTSFTETARFKVLGAFIDASRNGVLRVDQAKALMRRFALMGLNQVIIYTEDTYEVPGEPFFGYLRGGYSQSELKELDDHAHDLGLEMQLCIQVLGHLEQLLQWPAYAANRDTSGILLAEDDATYALIEKMVVAATRSLRCKTLQIGMDEAHGLGSGRYRKLHGIVPPFDILNRHLTRVREICRTHGINPRIMSDMYFRLGSKVDHYYDTDCVIPAEVIKDIPKDVGLTYWDYYHTSPDFYENWIDRHRALGSEPIMWTGVWTWCRMWAGLPFSLSAIDACMTASKKKKLPEVAACMWGDDGTECDIYSALPGLQFFAEHGHAEQVDPL